MQGCIFLEQHSLVNSGSSSPQSLIRVTTDICAIHISSNNSKCAAVMPLLCSETLKGLPWLPNLSPTSGQEFEMAEAALLAKAQTHCVLPSVHRAHEQRPCPVMPALQPRGGMQLPSRPAEHAAAAFRSLVSLGQRSGNTDEHLSFLLRFSNKNPTTNPSIL